MAFNDFSHLAAGHAINGELQLVMWLFVESGLRVVHAVRPSDSQIDSQATQLGVKRY